MNFKISPYFINLNRLLWWPVISWEKSRQGRLRPVPGSDVIEIYENWNAWILRMWIFHLEIQTDLETR